MLHIFCKTPATKFNFKIQIPADTKAKFKIQHHHGELDFSHKVIVDFISIQIFISLLCGKLSFLNKFHDLQMMPTQISLHRLKVSQCSSVCLANKVEGNLCSKRIYVKNGLLFKVKHKRYQIYNSEIISSPFSQLLLLYNTQKVVCFSN